MSHKQILVRYIKKYPITNLTISKNFLIVKVLVN